MFALKETTLSLSSFSKMCVCVCVRVYAIDGLLFSLLFDKWRYELQITTLFPAARAAVASALLPINIYYFYFIHSITMMSLFFFLSSISIVYWMLIMGDEKRILYGWFERKHSDNFKNDFYFNFVWLWWIIRRTFCHGFVTVKQRKRQKYFVIL